MCQEQGADLVDGGGDDEEQEDDHGVPQGECLSHASRLLRLSLLNASIDKPFIPMCTLLSFYKADESIIQNRDNRISKPLK